MDPVEATTPTPRSIFVTPSVKEYLESDHQLAQAARVDLERFIQGKPIVAALYRDHKNCRIARLDRPRDEVWEFRILDSDPQLRLFGRFASRDVFIALIGPIEHEYVATNKDYKKAIAECKEDWGNLFGFYSPLVGVTVYDYISKPVCLV